MKGDVRYIVRGAIVGALFGAVAGLLLGSLGNSDLARDDRPIETARVLKLGVGALALIRQLVDL